MNLFKGKKGQGNAYIGISLILLTYAVLFIVCYLVLSAFVDYMAVSPYWNADMASATSKFLGALQLLDYIMLFLTIVLIVGLGLTTYRLATPPIYFIINLVAGIFYGFLAYFLSYFFQQFAGNALFTATLAYFPRTVLVVSNLHWVILIALCVGSITLFAKKPKGQYVE